jgi:hypothetical protein
MDIIYPDLVKMTKQITKFMDVKNEKYIEENQNNTKFVNRFTDFRNLQNLDPNFLKRKEKVLWPILDFNDNKGSTKASEII